MITLEGGKTNDTNNGADTGVVALAGRAGFGRQADGNGGLTGQTYRDRVLGDKSCTGRQSHRTPKIDIPNAHATTRMADQHSYSYKGGIPMNTFEDVFTLTALKVYILQILLRV